MTTSYATYDKPGYLVSPYPQNGLTYIDIGRGLYDAVIAAKYAESEWLALRREWGLAGVRVHGTHAQLAALEAFIVAPTNPKENDQ